MTFDLFLLTLTAIILMKDHLAREWVQKDECIFYLALYHSKKEYFLRDLGELTNINYFLNTPLYTYICVVSTVLLPFSISNNFSFLTRPSAISLVICTLLWVSICRLQLLLKLRNNPDTNLLRPETFYTSNILLIGIFAGPIALNYPLVWALIPCAFIASLIGLTTIKRWAIFQNL